MNKKSALVVGTVVATLIAGALPADAGNKTKNRGYASAGTTQEACPEHAPMIAGKGDATPLQTFTVEAKAPKDPQVGETVTIPVLVTRPAERDPLGQGIPIGSPRSQAASGIDVSVGLVIGEVFLLGHGVTDQGGKAVVKIRIGKHVKPGAVDANFHAWKSHAELPCVRLAESGYHVYRGFFSIRPTS